MQNGMSKDWYRLFLLKDTDIKIATLMDCVLLFTSPTHPLFTHVRVLLLWAGLLALLGEFDNKSAIKMSRMEVWVRLETVRSSLWDSWSTMGFYRASPCTLGHTCTDQWVYGLQLAFSSISCATCLSIATKSDQRKCFGGTLTLILKWTQYLLCCKTTK